MINTNDLTPEELAELRGDTFNGQEYLDDEGNIIEADEEEIEEEDEDPKSVDEEDGEDIEEEEDDEVDPRYSVLEAQLADTKKRSDWLEAQLAALIGKATKEETPQVKFDFEAKEEEYTSLILEGETVKAAKLRSQIDNERTAQIFAKFKEESEAFSKKSTEEAKALLEQEKFNSTIDSLEEKYPFLKPGSKKYNKEAVETVNALTRGLVETGTDRVTAIKKAVAKVLPLYNQDKPIEVKKAKSVQVAIDAAKRQPPKTSGVKGESFKVSPKPIHKMTDKEFASLTAQQIRELRGDFNV
jgi:hypothetical protein